MTLIAAACTGSSSTDMESYADAWVEAWSEADPYDIARFYDVDTVVVYPQADYQLDNPAGFSWVGADLLGADGLVAWVPTHVAPQERDVVYVGVGEESATVVAIIPDVGSALWHDLTISTDRITQEVMLSWRDAHKPRGEPDPRLAWVDDLVGRYVDSLPGDARLREIVTGDRSGPAIFKTPGPDPWAVAFLVETDECTTAVRLALEERAITEEDAHTEIGCQASAAGWWDQLELPGPIDDREARQITVAGATIEVTASTAEAEDLLRWGLGRFEEAGLASPNVTSVGFAPNKACADAAGVAVDNADGSGNFVLCTNAHQICLPDRDQCSSYATSAKLGLLHELAHVWLLANLDDGRRDAFMGLAGVETWASGSVPWHERGAEHAAETVAWGLMDERLELVRIDNPSCEQATAGFYVLTGSEPITECR